jgi:hypothetical protein
MWSAAEEELYTGSADGTIGVWAPFGGAARAGGGAGEDSDRDAWSD